MFTLELTLCINTEIAHITLKLLVYLPPILNGGTQIKSREIILDQTLEIRMTMNNVALSLIDTHSDLL